MSKCICCGDVGFPTILLKVRGTIICDRCCNDFDTDKEVQEHLKEQIKFEIKKSNISTGYQRPC